MNDISNGVVIDLTGFHRAKPYPTADQLCDMILGPVRPNPFLNMDALRKAVFELPNGVKLGKEIYIGAVEGHADTPWELVVGLDAAYTERSEKNLLDIRYGLTVTTLKREAYGDFFAGDLDPELAGVAMTELSISDIKASWDSCKEYLENGEALIRPCYLVNIQKQDRTAFKKHGNPMGKEFLARDRGDEPLAITGLSLEVNPGRIWKNEVYCRYTEAGYDYPFAIPITQLLRVPIPAALSQTPRVQAG